MASTALQNLLSESQYGAVLEFVDELSKVYRIYDIGVFGSAARRESGEESDLDLLVLTEDKVSHRDRNRMSGILFEINLKYGSNISMIVIERDKWYSGIMPLTPLYKEIQKDGVFLNEYA